MQIYPNIEILSGKCVNLKHKANSDPTTIFDITPINAAKAFEKGGAEYLQIVDLDGVFEHDTDNADLIKQIIDSVSIPVQVSGGIRSMTTADHWIEHGADRVVLGTVAVLDPHLVEELCTKYPGKIVVSIDAKEGKVVTHGWRDVSTFTALELAKRYERSGVAAIIYTDIDRYNELPESSIANTEELASQLSCPVISSGTIHELDDISILTQLPNIDGAITGWALFHEIFTIEEALNIASHKLTTAKWI